MTTADLALEIPIIPPTYPTLFLVTAKYSGQGRYTGQWKVFKQIHLTEDAAQKFVAALKPAWTHRRLWQIGSR
jgi:hypothetical protein